jgi:hypothetical protein
MTFLRSNMTEYIWTSPGGTYNVPSDFRTRFQNEFPGYRIRWSLKQSKWLIEQPTGQRGALPAIKLDLFDDTLIRERDGFWLVMSFQPGSRMACPIDGTTMSVPFRKMGETACETCRSRKRDGRIIAGFFPFDETLIEYLRSTDPRYRGIIKHEGKYRVTASVRADESNKLLERARQSKLSDSTSSLDAVDWRWISGIPTAGRTRRQLTDKDFS